MTQLVTPGGGQDCVVEINGNHLSGTSATEEREQTEKQEERRDQSNRQPLNKQYPLCLRGEGQGTKNIVMFYSGQRIFILHVMKST